ncbi:MAG: hypothetical protein BSR46_11955 [Candidatus Dactylopiibacterium carminicum]|nr:type II secretion system protein N [Candidatus Dactylopiibacterium carminicum]PAS98574.1 MAG: hypothetical protein BSR46_11955 [Candidatus Dactylopiibacterium carminicum]
MLKLSFPSFTAIRLPPLKQPERWLGLLNLLLVAILCWLVIGILGRLAGWQGSPPVLALPAAPAADTQGGLRALTAWFSPPPGEAAPLASDFTNDLRLIAVIAGREGVALIGGAQPATMALAVGDELRAGVRLLEVQPDRVIFEQAGNQHELAFPQTAEASAAAGGITDPGLIRPAKPRARPAPRQTSELARGQLSGVVQRGNLANWDKGLAAFPDGGIRITSVADQPLARLLKLRDGDIVKRVNDREIKGLPDISLLYHHFSQSSEVELVVLRDGKPQNLHFKIQP